MVTSHGKLNTFLRATVLVLMNSATCAGGVLPCSPGTFRHIVLQRALHGDGSCMWWWYVVVCGGGT